MRMLRMSGKLLTVKVAAPLFRLVIFFKNYKMGIAHGDGSPSNDALGALNLSNDIGSGRKRNRLAGLRMEIAKTGCPHVDPYALHVPLDNLQFRLHDSGQSLDQKLRLGRQLLIIDMAGETADSVSAHLGFASIGIKNPHLEISGLGRKNDDKAVGADA